MMTSFLRSLAVLVGLVGVFADETCGADQYVIQEVMSGLVTPRGLAFGPDGGLYVAEGGSGGTGPSVILGSGNESFFGTTSALSRLLGGVQQRVLDGLPGLSTANGQEAGGLQDILFDGSGQAYGLFGLGANPASRNTNLGTAGANLGRIVRLALDGSGLMEPVADIAGHELTANPDGTNVDSNPFKFALTSSGDFVVADAGANDFVKATTAGVVTTLGVLPARPNMLPIGPPMFQSVPTAIAIGADEKIYVGQLTGFPFPPGEANVYRFDPASLELTVAHTGFTNIIDLAFDQDQNLYVLQITSNGLASATGPGSGRLIKIDATTGDRTAIASDGLVFPGGLAIGPEGTLYVTNRTNTTSGGQVLSIRLVPEPSSGLLVAGAFLFAGLGCRSWRAT